MLVILLHGWASAHLIMWAIHVNLFTIDVCQTEQSTWSSLQDCCVKAILDKIWK
jgi:hypothetical protein